MAGPSQTICFTRRPQEVQVSTLDLPLAIDLPVVIVVKTEKTDRISVGGLEIEVEDIDEVDEKKAEKS